VITKEQYEEARNNFTKPGGCLEMAMECREQQQKYDPYNWGNNAEVNAICIAADAYCYENVLGAYALSGVSNLNQVNQ
jgi:carboxypeptidase D